MPHLFDTLLRFRSYTVALTADLEKAFHQIEIKEADRDFLRFLWYDNGEFTIHYVGHYGYSKRSGFKRASSMDGNPRHVLLHFATYFGAILRTDDYPAI